MAQQKDNTGYLYPNHKRDNERAPNTKGAFTVGGVEYWASGWTNIDNAGQRYVKVILTPKGEEQSKTQRKLDEQKQNPDDDIPF